jgi:hypothetical protein
MGRIAPGKAHPVDHDPVRLGGRGNDESTWTHAEAVHAPIRARGADLVEGRRQACVARGLAVLDAIDHRLRMFQANAHRTAFAFKRDARASCPLVHVPRGMAAGENDDVRGISSPSRCEQRKALPCLDNDIKQ